MIGENASSPNLGLPLPASLVPRRFRYPSPPPSSSSHRMLLHEPTSSSFPTSTSRKRLPFLLLLSLLTAGLLLSIPMALSPAGPDVTWSHDPSFKHDVELDVQVVQAAKPVMKRCEKTMLYLLSGPHGFASEWIILLRAAWFAKEHGYELLVDSDEGWVYGNMLEYLLPHQSSCVPDTEWRTRERAFVGEEGWQNQTQVFTSRYHGRDQIEDHFRLLLSPLHLTSSPPLPIPPTGPHETFPVLPADKSLPPAYVAAYEAISPLAREWWVPSHVIEGQIGVLREVWRMGERKTVRAHVRMGDKIGEQADDETRNGGAVTFKQGDLKAYLAAAEEMLLLVPPPTSPPTSGEELKPLLILMSDSPSLLSSFPPSLIFEIVQLPVPSLATSSFGGHSEMEFGALTRAQRVQLTEGFVRDMTMMSREVGGFVGTGSSNVGDVISLLMGEKRVKGEGMGGLGQARSLDSPWYWTSWLEVW